MIALVVFSQAIGNATHLVHRIIVRFRIAAAVERRQTYWQSVVCEYYVPRRVLFGPKGASRGLSACDCALRPSPHFPAPVHW